MLHHLVLVYFVTAREYLSRTSPTPKSYSSQDVFNVEPSHSTHNVAMRVALIAERHKEHARVFRFHVKKMAGISSKVQRKIFLRALYAF